ncbi:OmpA family protein [Flavobacterium sp. RSB2_4_14]|uniref:OmpA family protein n=1 Tax=Flavobacterium sp. RSB2_4_14 TaxID=3447665 RepID=UPI003F372EBF
MNLKIVSLFFLLSIVKGFSQERFVVYFNNNKFELNPSEQGKLDKWISDNKTSKIVSITGSTDEIGSLGYNDTLSQKRVNFIYSKVIGKLKIREDFKTISLGEKGATSDNNAENRKAVIHYLLEKDLHLEEEILGIKKEIKEEQPKPEIVYPEKLVFENPNGTKSEFKLDRAFMKKVGEAKPGEKLKIENLNFIINTFAVVNESRGKMYELLLVLQKNPQMKIEIHGHLCCMPVDRTDLSTQRAKAIYNFLIQNEIDKSRLSYKGFGSTQPIYPLPEKDEKERAANRRVEILILEN